MSNGKSTEQGFKAVGASVYQLEFDRWHRGVEQMRNRFYAHVLGYRDTPAEELEAIARLFAAAPMLLEALKEVTQQYENVRAAEGFPTAESRSTKLAKEAIAKAEGKND